MSSPLPPPPPPLQSVELDEKKKRSSLTPKRKLGRNFSGRSRAEYAEVPTPILSTSLPNTPTPITSDGDELPRLITPPIIDVEIKSRFILQADAIDESDSMEEGNSPETSRRRLKKRISVKVSKKKIVRERKPRMTDNTLRLVASMYENKDDIDPRVFLFDAKEGDGHVVYAEDVDDDDYNSEYPAVKSATIEKLIVGLTPENYFDQDFTFAFLFNYRSFTNAETIIDLLRLRWNLPAPQKPSKSGLSIDNDTFEKKKLKPIRLRIYNVIKMWIEDHWKDIDKETNTLLKDFITEMSLDMPQAVSLCKLLDNPKSRDDLMFDQKPPKPFIPMNLKSTMTILDLHPEEVARQMTIIDSNLFRGIKPQEFLNLGWTKSDKETRAPGILAMISSFNHVTYWISTEIISQQDLKTRATVITRFICVAQKCLELNNFNGLMEIIAALQNSAIHRLYNTWEIIPARAMEIYNDLSTLMNSNDGEGNFHNYREALKKAVPPVIPYLGLCLTDLTFLNDGNAEFANEEKKMVNFMKMTKIGKVVRHITSYQQAPYCLTSVGFVQDYIKGFHVLSDQELYDQSTLLEKRIPKAQRTAIKESRKEIKKLKIDLKAFNISD